MGIGNYRESQSGWKVENESLFRSLILQWKILEDLKLYMEISEFI